MTNEPSGETTPPGKTALESTADFTKFSTAFTAGALAFSTGLLGDKFPLPDSAKWPLIIAWGLLTASLIAGVLVYARVPVQLAEQNYDLENKFLIWPGRVHQLAFMVALLFLGFVLINTLLYPSKPIYKLASAYQVIPMIKEGLPPEARFVRLVTVELIQGLDQSGTHGPVWHVQAEIERAQQSDQRSYGCKCVKSCCVGSCTCKAYTIGPRWTRSFVDFVVDAKTGELLALP